MSITNKRSYVWKDRKERPSQSDTGKKYRVIKILRDCFKLNALGLVDEFIYARNKETNQVIISRWFEQSEEATLKGIDSNTHQRSLFHTHKVNRIDLFIPQANPQRIIEIDGLYHGFGDEITESQQTHDRNLNYRQGGFTEERKTLVILTDDDMKNDDLALKYILEAKLGIRSIPLPIRG